jgi:hypothetical protein
VTITPSLLSFLLYLWDPFAVATYGCDGASSRVASADVIATTSSKIIAQILHHKAADKTEYKRSVLSLSCV